MPKRLLQIVALLLAATLVADPATAAALRGCPSFRSTRQTQIDSGMFERQALAGQAIFPIRSLQLVPGSQLKHH